MTPNGTAIRAIRRSQHLSLREVAARTGRDVGFLSRLERGQSGASEETLRRIAAALTVPVAAINREEQP
ncbi:helix-turn-helix domain-containing protein [Kitasatospora sp. NPDC018058]|uniref:helix-turn-helix domain-containing protein n=1 Tax=Kitasatospora sp. NPDC018058 TaxID=3364025 RepID=UPI0037BFEEC8